MPCPDRHQLLELLLGSDRFHIVGRGRVMQQRAVAGADPGARTRIDDFATPLEEAEYLGRAKTARLLRRLMPG